MRKISLFLLIVLITFANAAVELPQYAPATLVTPPLLRVETGNICTTLFGPQCGDDCSSILTCTGKPEPLYVNSCEDYDINTPYCVDGKCVANPDVNNPVCTSIYPFACTATAAFPDPDDCTIYHVCSAAGAQSKIMKCPLGYTYISSLKLCKRTTECQTFDCSTSSNKMIAYEFDPTYYALCYKGANNAKQTIVYKCADNFSYDAVGGCKYNCKSEGYFVHPDNCNAYVSCVGDGTGTTYQSTVINCPAGSYFSVENFLCIPEKTKCVSQNAQPVI